MNEITDETLVRQIGDALINDGIKPASQAMQLFFDVYCFDLEIGSGGSFDQYFRWSQKAELDRIIPALKTIGLNSIIDSTQQAITLAFPEGVPADPDDYEDCLELTEEQEDALTELYDNEENIHVLIEEKLAAFARDNNLLGEI